MLFESIKINNKKYQTKKLSWDIKSNVFTDDHFILLSIVENIL